MSNHKLVPVEPTADVAGLQAELERELQRRFDGNEQASREHRAEVKALVEASLELQQENNALLKDKARLDWLADVNNNIGNVQLPRAIVERNLGSLRDAIDAAMSID